MKSASDLITQFENHLTPEQASLVARAYDLAQKAHEGQKRYSGEPYFIHPLATAEILISLHLDPEVVAAGLLHDVTDDTAVTSEQIETEFGPGIARMVHGVSNVSNLRLPKHSQEEFVENLRQFFLVVASDIRVVYIKLADRLHNMRTLQFAPPEAQQRLSRETLEIFAPLADRLGIGEIKGQLEDLAFPYVYPKEFAWVENESQKYFADIDQILPEIKERLSSLLRINNINFDLQSRAKHKYSLYKKLLLNDRDFARVYDLIAVRIIVDDVSDCYNALGLIHKEWVPLAGRIKDYIAQPKANGYQSLHTTVVGTRGKIFEVQIRTWEMHDVAEKGIAAHWRYSEVKQNAESDIAVKNWAPSPSQKLDWLDTLIKWQSEISESEEFLEGLKKDFLNRQIFVYTPEGDVVNLPYGATPVDFAYAIHSDLGDYCVGAKINGKMSSLATPLENGQIVEIIKGKKVTAKKDWLKFVVTVAAKRGIRKNAKL